MKTICLVMFGALFWGVFLTTSVRGGIIYPYPDEVPRSARYQVFVDGKEASALHTKRGAICAFGMDGRAEIRVLLDKKPGQVVVRPLSKGIKASVEGHAVSFDLEKPMNLSVEIDGDLSDPLFLFANPPSDPPERSDPKVHYFEAGRIHEPGEVVLKDGETLYLEGGAIVRSVVRARNADQISIRGEGILDATTRSRKINMLVLRECKDVRIENITLLDPLGWTMHLSASESVELSNVRVVGWRANSDGLDIEHSSRVRVRNCFWRTNDDCIAIKAIYPPGTDHVPFEEMINPETLGGHEVSRVVGSSMGDIEISDCVLWNDSGGQGFEIGFELRVDSIRNITFRDSDIIHVRGGGAFTIHNGDRARIENVLIEDVRVEDAERFVDFQIGLSIYSQDCPMPFRRSNSDRVAVPREHRLPFANNPYQWYVPLKEDLPKFSKARGGVRGVTFRNVSLLRRPAKQSFLIGYSQENPIRDVVFEGLTIAGQKIKDAEDAGISLLNAETIEFR